MSRRMHKTFQYLHKASPLLSPKPSPRPHPTPLVANTSAPSRTRCRTRACSPISSLDSLAIAPILHASWLGTEPAFHNLRREDVVLAATECGPDTGEEVVEVGGEETGGLGHGLRLAIDDECHE